MSRYNIETLSFLVASFKDITASFGSNSKSVEFYKRQVQQLINIGQIRELEANLIEELVGMKNTNAVKWDKANAKIEEFCSAINHTYGIKSETDKVLLLERMKGDNILSESVKQLVYKVYDIELKDTKTRNTNTGFKFGEINNNINKATKDKNVNKDKLASLLNYARNKGEQAVIKVRKSYAVCSSGSVFISCDLCEITKRQSVMIELAKGAEFTVGVERVTGDACHCRRELVQDAKLMAMIKEINWKDIVDDTELYSI